MSLGQFKHPYIQVKIMMFYCWYDNLSSDVWSSTKSFKIIILLLSLSFNSLAPGKFEWNFKYLILQIISVIDGWGISCELALGWMSLDITHDKSTLVQVMAWCRQATSHYLSQCWLRSLSPYGITRPQWVKTGANQIISWMSICYSSVKINI